MVRVLDIGPQKTLAPFSMLENTERDGVSVSAADVGLNGVACAVATSTSRLFEAVMCR